MLENIPWYTAALRKKDELVSRSIKDDIHASTFAPKQFMNQYLASNFPQTVAHPSEMQRQAFLESTMKGIHPSEVARNSLRGVASMPGKTVSLDSTGKG